MEGSHTEVLYELTVTRILVMLAGRFDERAATGGTIYTLVCSHNTKIRMCTGMTATFTVYLHVLEASH